MYLAYFDDAEVDLEKILEIKKNGLKLVENGPFYSIVNMRNVYGVMNNEVKEFVANNEELNHLKIIELLLVNSLPLKILTKGYLSFNKPKTETIVIKSIDQLVKTLKDRFPSITGVDELEEYLKL